MRRQFETFRLTCLLLAGCFFNPPHGLAESLPQQQESLDAEKPAPSESFSSDLDDVRHLLTDTASFEICNRLRGRILNLSTGRGARSDSAAEPVAGNLWIRQCSGEVTAPYTVSLKLSGMGWRWIDRTRQKLGASFKVDETVKFLSSMKAEATIDLQYDRRKHIVTLRLIPSSPVEMEFRVMGDTNVKTDTLWSSLLGQAAQLTGEDLEHRTVEKIRDAFIHRFRAKLHDGLSIIMDLCTGDRFIKTGMFPAGRLPPEAGSRSRNYMEHEKGILWKRGLIMAGPYEPGEQVSASIAVQEGGPLKAHLMCRADAKVLAETYVASSPATRPGLEEVQSLKEAIVAPGESTTLQADSPSGCFTVLVFSGFEETAFPALFKYHVQNNAPEKKTYMECHKK